MNENTIEQLLQAINTLQDLGKVAYFNKGAYNSETTYELNDVVTYGGGSYVSMVNENRGNLPTNITYWNVVAEKGNTGETGKPFVIEKTYASIEDMVADYDNMNVNDYVMIQGNVEEEENATLWTKTETEASPYKWVYLADFSGASGITGQTPNIQIGNVTEGNEPVVTRRSGSSNENPILDFVLKTGATGQTGETGNGIASITKTSTSGLVDTYTITFTNGQTTTYQITNGANGSVVDVQVDGTSVVDNGVANIIGLTEMKQELEDMYNLLPKVQGTGETITLNNTAIGKMGFIYGGNTYQESPSGYTAVEYIESSGTQYIDTNYTPVQNDSIEIKRFKPNSITNTPVVFSAGTTDPQFIFLFDSYHSIFYKYFASGNAQSFEVNDMRQQEQTIKIDSTGIYFNGVKKGTSTYSGAVNSPLRLLHRANSIGEKYNGRIGRITITNGNITKLDLLPCYRNNDNVVGMYDLVSNTFYTNSGTGTFTYGSVVPNPDYPQDIQVVSGDNTIIVSNSDNTQSASYPISLPEGMELCKMGDYQDKIDKSTGKNLFDKNNVNSSQIIPYDGSISASTNGKTLWISCKPNTTYTISKIVGTRFQVFTTQSVPSVGVSYSDYLSDATASHLTITTSANAKYLCIYYYHSSDTLTEQQILNSIQIEEGTQATSYEPYGKIWYLNKQIGKVVLNGSESETFTYELVDGYDAFKYNCNNMLRTNVGLGVSNYYHNTNGVSLFGDGIVRFGWFNYYIYFINDTSRFSGTISNFKTWLNAHNVIIYFLLATPTTTEITDTTLISQLEAIKKSYTPQTNISQTNNDMPFILDVTAIQNL